MNQDTAATKNEAFAALNDKLEKVGKSLASMDEKEEKHEKMEYLRAAVQDLYAYCQELSNRMYAGENSLYSSINQHYEGHLPKLTVGQLKKLIAAAGAEEDYEVVKRAVYAKDKSGKIVAKVSFR